MKKLLIALLLFAGIALAQVAITTAPMDGTVTDQQDAVVAGAQVTVVSDIGASFKTTTNERGQWALPSMPQGSYKVTVAMKGFRTTVIDGVAMNAGVPATVNAKLEVGAVTETVEVSGAQELVNTSSANVSATLEKRQMTELPTLSRGGLDLLMSLSGIQTSGVDRNSTINGLPAGAISITVDGVNTQDQVNKSSSSSSYFTFIPIQQDSVEEVTLSTAAANADSTGEGAAQVKFITKSGTNDFHGGGFWQNRNTWFTANSFFNTINHQPRSIVKLNQYGFHVGGPVYIPGVMNLKNKLFFFTNVEFRLLPASASYSRTMPTQDAVNGFYTSGATNGTVYGRVNVLSLAQGAGFGSNVDPIVAKTYSQILALQGNCASVTNRIASAGDFNSNTCNYTVGGMDRRHLSMTRVDYNLNSRNQVSLTYSYNMYNTAPDVLNNAVPIYPGTGEILGSNVNAGQSSNRFSGTLAVRSTLTSHMTNAFQSGLEGGTTVYGSAASSPANYSQWRGYVPSIAYASISTVNTYVQRRNTPVKQLSDTVTWLKGAHMLSFGGDFSQINYWGQYFGTETFPTLSLGIATGDPVHNGTTDAFSISKGGTMVAGAPGVTTTATQTQADSAASLYASLTGRVSGITRQVVESETTHQYGPNSSINRDQQRQFGFFAQDSWKVRPNLTVNLGLHMEQQRPPVNLSNLYTASTMQAAYGVSGIGNLFKPGVTTGGMTVQSGGAAYAPAIAAFQPLSAVTEYHIPVSWDPNIGIAWQIPHGNSILGPIFGSQAVLRAGYSISTIRENIGMLSSMYGGNPGLNYPASVDPVNYPQYFGQPGSVSFSQGTLPTIPTPTAPTYPMNTTASTSVNAFDPNLKLGYVESWNLSLQRQIGRDDVLEIRYQGNHEVKGWRQVQLNEVNVFENGFLSEFQNAYNNLVIARNGNINNTNSNNFDNQGLPGQVAIPMMHTALSPSGLTNNSTYATYIRQNRPYALANVIYPNATYMGRLVSAGYPANLFTVNPSVGSSGSYLVTNWGSSFWDAGVVEYRHRFSHGTQIQANYTLSKALANGSTGNSSVYAAPTTFRNLALDKAPWSADIRHALKTNFIYDLPFGHGKAFLSGNTIEDKIFGGWEMSGILRTQSGSPTQIGGRTGINAADPGAELVGMSAKQLQSMMHITKTTGPASSSAWGGLGQVWSPAPRRGRIEYQ